MRIQKRPWLPTVRVTCWTPRSAPCRRRGPRRSRVTGSPATRRAARAGSLLRSRLVLFHRHQLVALRAHAEVREARFLHELVAEGVVGAGLRPDEKAAA